MTAKRAFLLWLACIAWPGALPAEPEPEPASWTWEFVRSGTPSFEGKDNDELLVVGVRFRNALATDRTLVLEQAAFAASSADGTPTPILGLLFQMQGMSGARRISVPEAPASNEMLADVRGEARTNMIRTSGPVEVVVPGGGSYVQGLLLAAAGAETGVSLRYRDLPALEIAPTDGSSVGPAQR